MSAGNSNKHQRMISRVARSPEELFPLLEYCRAGKLKEVEEWIATGKPLDPPQTARRSRRRSPMEIAIEKGFFALAELLLQGGSSADEGTLDFAVAHQQIEIAKLFLEHGVTGATVSGYTAFGAGLEMVTLLIKHGFDPTAEFAFYHALCSHVQGNLALLKEYKDRFPDLQRQAEMALAHHCQKGGARAVGLLLWAGARADAQVPSGTESHDAEMPTTALEEAARVGNLAILKQLKPEQFPEVVKGMLDRAWLKPSQEMVDYLLGLGALLNDRPSGGSSFLRSLIGSLDFASQGLFGFADTKQIELLFELISHVIGRGAKWIPDEDERVRHQRDRLRRIKPEHLSKLFKMLKEGGAASGEMLEAILNTPSFKRQLGVHFQEIEQLLHPPPPKPVPTPEAKAPTKILPSKPRPPVGEQRLRAEELLLDTIRRRLTTHFTQTKEGLSLYAPTARRRLGLPRDDKEDLMPAFTKAAESLNKRVQTFSVEFNAESWCRAHQYFSVRLKDGYEWPDVVQEAWAGVESPNAHFLTDTGLRLFELIRSGELAAEFVAAGVIASKIGIGHYEQGVACYLLEIVAKAPVDLRWEQQPGSNYLELGAFRIWIGDAEKPKEAAPSINPRFEVDLQRFGKAEIDAARKQLHELVVQAKPMGTTPIHILSLKSRPQLTECFPNATTVDSSALSKFFGVLTFNESLKQACSFHEHASEWWFVLRPKEDWATSIKAIRDELAQPSLEVCFGLSAEAARLLAWVKSLPPDQMLGCYTPIVEDQRERGISIASPWGSDNFPAYVQMLVDEINQKAGFDLRLQPWREYSATKTRLKVATQISDLDDVLGKLHQIAWMHGTIIDRDSTRRVLEDITLGKVTQTNFKVAV